MHVLYQLAVFCSRWLGLRSSISNARQDGAGAQTELWAAAGQGPAVLPDGPVVALPVLSFISCRMAWLRQRRSRGSS